MRLLSSLFYIGLLAEWTFNKKHILKCNSFRDPNMIMLKK